MNATLPIPKYHQIYLLLREQLAEGRFVGKLPSELTLVKEFDVGRVTVRRALERLAAEGLIKRTAGRGTVPLKAPPPTATAAPMNGLLENIVAVSLRTSIKVVEHDTVRAPEAVAAALGLPREAPVRKAVRVRSTREGPLSCITTYVPLAIIGDIGRNELARKAILVLLEERGVRIGRASQTITARLADAVVARHLDVEVGSALLAVNRLTRDVDDRPVLWLQGLYRPDRYQYQMQLSRVGDIDAKVWVSTGPATEFH